MFVAIPRLLLGLLLTFSIAACSPPDDLVIDNVTIVSAHLVEPLSNQHVLIRDGRIQAISETPIEVGSSIRRLDGSGRYLTPGLMDSHHHVSFVPGLGAFGVANAAAHGTLADAYMKQQPRSLLYHGVTQILDPSPLLAWRRFEDSPRHPDLFRCGEIPNLGGYPGNQLPDGSATGLYTYVVDESESGTPEAVVRRIAEDGAICVKIFIEDGFGDRSDWPLLSDDLIGRIRHAAHELNLPVVAHANSIDMYHVALRNQVDVIAHGMWNWQWPEEQGTPPVMETLDRVREDGVGYMATHRVMAGLADLMRPESLADPGFGPIVPSPLLEWYADEEAKWFAAELASDFPPGMSHEEIADALDSGYQRAQRATAYLAESGHPLLLGSDCPGSPTYVNQPGLCTLREMQDLAAAGVPLRAVLEAATINNARQFGLEDDYGTIEVGKLANLLLLSANPLETVAAWNRIETIVLHGEPLARDTLDAR